MVTHLLYEQVTILLFYFGNAATRHFLSLASVAQPPGKCLGSVALRPAISNGLPLSVTAVRIFDMILWGELKIRQKRCQWNQFLGYRLIRGAQASVGTGLE